MRLNESDSPQNFKNCLTEIVQLLLGGNA